MANHLYYHPIYVTDNVKFRITFTIFNTSPTAFTYNTVKTYIKNLMDDGAIISCNGWYIDGSNPRAQAYMIYKVGANNYCLFSSNETSEYNVNIDTLTDSQFHDGINLLI